MSVTRITRACIVCGVPSTLVLTDEEAAAVDREHYTQDALPDWTADRRELLISGTHPECWAAAFPEEDDEPR